MKEGYAKFGGDISSLLSLAIGRNVKGETVSPPPIGAQIKLVSKGILLVEINISVKAFQFLFESKFALGILQCQRNAST